MINMKLDLKDLSLFDLRSYKENIIRTIGRLKSGLFNAEAALGLNTSIDMLTNMYNQINLRLSEIESLIPNIQINVGDSDEA